MRKTLVAVACIAIVGITVAEAAQRGGSVSGVQQRSYRFPETNEKIEYDVFVSRKVDKKKPSPLVIALHGQNMPPLGMMRYLTDAADKGGYIVATPTGYNLQGWYGANGPGSSSTKPENLGELSEKDVMHVLDLMRKEFLVDDHRIYLLGQSMGGGGAMQARIFAFFDKYSKS